MTAIKNELLSSEWPDWMNPILVRTLRQTLKSRGFEWIFIWVCGSSSLIAVYQLLQPAGLAPYEDGSLLLFWGNAILILHVLLPARMAMTLKDDRSRGNFDLILMTATPADVQVRQHIKSLAMQAMMVVSILLPFVLLRYYLGGAELLRELAYLGLLYVDALVLGCVLVWWTVSGMVAKVVLGFLALGMVPTFEVVTGLMAFGMGRGVDASPAVIWIFMGLLGSMVSLAVAEDQLVNPMEDPS